MWPASVSNSCYNVQRGGRGREDEDGPQEVGRDDPRGQGKRSLRII
jgi:hypothetical protein